jgi:hypothetical protein
MSEAKAAYTPKSTKDVWDHHFGGFATQNVQETLLDYTEESWVKVYNNTTQKLAVYKGLAEIEGFFSKLFSTLTDMTGTAAPIQDVDEATGTVFLIWQVTGSGYTNCTDTFVVDTKTFKIKAQTVVVNKAE